MSVDEDKRKYELHYGCRVGTGVDGKFMEIEDQSSDSFAGNRGKSRSKGEQLDCWSASHDLRHVLRCEVSGCPYSKLSPLDTCVPGSQLFVLE
jgi:hypothetical protein